ncbi:MAG: hypothetical protein L3J83_08125 [Proteobacteria bacterium]|nr:hypothetical protein [Pseudomonadota bacterium]
MTKVKAALIHTLISICVISLFAIIVFFIWYPKPFAAISGVIEPLKLLILIDVIIGPLLTFVVYKKNKKYLKLDLTLIALMQIAALFYGAYTIYNGRPSMVVMHNGEFVYLIEEFSNHEQLTVDELKPGLFTKPKLAYIESTKFVDVYNAYSDMQPIEDYDKRLLPYSLNSANMKAKFTNKIEEIDDLLSQYDSDDIAFFKLDKEGSKYYVLYSKSHNAIVDYLRF